DNKYKDTKKRNTPRLDRAVQNGCQDKSREQKKINQCIEKSGDGVHVGRQFLVIHNLFSSSRLIVWENASNHLNETRSSTPIPHSQPKEYSHINFFYSAA